MEQSKGYPCQIKPMKNLKSFHAAIFMLHYTAIGFFLQGYQHVQTYY